MLDIKARASVVPDMAEDAGVSIIDNGREGLLKFVDVLCVWGRSPFWFCDVPPGIVIEFGEGFLGTDCSYI